jgi:hypothetical protein
MALRPWQGRILPVSVVVELELNNIKPPPDKIEEDILRLITLKELPSHAISTQNVT